MHALKRLWANRKGYTIDQTILIVAIIAILITLIIVTIGWTLLNRTGGTKLASQLQQVETAVAQFYEGPGNRQFPASLAQLQNNGLTSYRTSGTVYLNDWNGAVTLALGSTGATPPVGMPANTQYVIMESAGVPLAEARRADAVIDGAEGTTSGRVIIRTSTQACIGTGTLQQGVAAYPATGNVTVCYLASRAS